MEYKFAHELDETLEAENKLQEKLRLILSSSKIDDGLSEFFDDTENDIFVQLEKLDDLFLKIITPILKSDLILSLDREFLEQFGEEEKKDGMVQFVRTKLFYESLSSHLKQHDLIWKTIFGISKAFETYESTKIIFKKFESEIFNEVENFSKNLKSFLEKLEEEFSCSIIGSSKLNPNYLVSNLFYDDSLNYDLKKLFPKFEEKKTISTSKPIMNPIKQRVTVKLNLKETEFHHTYIKGTKEWNRNDSYVLFIKRTNLLEEQKKFYSASFVTLNPSENVNINMAAALVRKNSGQAQAPKYSKMIQTLLEFTTNSIFAKDFPYVTDDTYSFLYHIGPVVIYNIISEDMKRRDFGYCHIIENNKIVRFFPDTILKKHIIDYWVDKFIDIKTDLVDGFINYQKGVSNIKASYKSFFDHAASTRRGINEKQPIEDYMRENEGKFFGYRRAQVFRRFVPDNIFGIMSEVSSTDLVKKFQ